VRTAYLEDVRLFVGVRRFPVRGAWESLLCRRADLSDPCHKPLTRVSCFPAAREGDASASREDDTRNLEGLKELRSPEKA